MRDMMSIECMAKESISRGMRTAVFEEAFRGCGQIITWNSEQLRKSVEVELHFERARLPCRLRSTFEKTVIQNHLLGSLDEFNHLCSQTSAILTKWTPNLLQNVFSLQLLRQHTYLKLFG